VNLSSHIKAWNFSIASFSEIQVLISLSEIQVISFTLSEIINQGSGKI